MHSSASCRVLTVWSTSASNDRVEKVSDALKVGDMVDVKLLDVDFDKKRISLSMKACLDENGEDAE